MNLNKSSSLNKLLFISILLIYVLIPAIANCEAIITPSISYVFDKSNNSWQQVKESKKVAQLGNFYINGNIKESKFYENNSTTGVALNSGNLDIYFKPLYKPCAIMSDLWKTDGMPLKVMVRARKNNEEPRIIYNGTLKYGEDLSNKLIYSINDILLEQNQYYIIDLSYRQTIETGKTNWLIFKETEERRCVQQIKLYVVNVNNESDKNISAINTPRKELGKKIKTDDTFSENKNLPIDDLHFGWDMGTFVVNGYTRETTDADGAPVFLKNVGDKVALWFICQQDINKLNGKEKLIVPHFDASDKDMEIERTNMQRGALFIKYTDNEGHSNIDPVKYFDFLGADVQKGANTKVHLFEEGDYKVKLDYKVKDDSSYILNTNNYKIEFKFKVRNGECMVHLFDLATGSELSNYGLAESGFNLNDAQSKYLNVDVTRQALMVGASGNLATDIRFSGPAKDLKEFTEEGIYSFKIKNIYTGVENTKTIFVGTNKYLKAMSINKISIEELNQKISNGYTVNADGELKQEEIK